MMLHRHFEAEKTRDNITRLADVSRDEPKRDEFVSEVFPPDPVVENKPKRGRPKKVVTD